MGQLVGLIKLKLVDRLYYCCVNYDKRKKIGRFWGKSRITTETFFRPKTK